jgi:serine phosphatase RsbU (regulator of sigma subunit)/uncharacterized protein HemY
MRYVNLCLLLVLVLICCKSNYAQGSNIDSLLLHYNQQKKDTNKIKTGFAISDHFQAERDFEKASQFLTEVATIAKEMPYVGFKHRTQRALAYNEYYRHQFEDAIVYCLQTEKHAREMKHDVYIAEIRNLMAGCHVNLGEYDKALEILDELIVFTRDKELYTNLALALTASAGVHYNLGEYETTANRLFETAETYKKLEDTTRLAQTYRNLSLIYGQIKNYKLAKKYVNEALQIGIKKGDRRRIVDAYSRYGTIYENEKKIDSALYFLNLAIKEHDPLFEEDLVEVYGTLGNIYRDLEDYDKATFYFEKTMKLVLQTRDRRMLSILYFNIGEMQVKQKKYKEALINFNLLVEYASDSGEKELLEKANYGLYQVHSALGNFEKALDAYIKYRQYGDTLREGEMTNRLNELESEKEKEYAQAMHDLELQKSEELLSKEKEQKRLITTVSITGALALLLFLLFMYNRYRITRRQKQVIEHQQQELKEKNDEILDSISYAKRIQDAFLPLPEVFHRVFNDGFLFFQPKDVVSGDFYWFYSDWNEATQQTQTRFIAAADCTGHGVPGALMSMICANALNEVVVNKGISDTGKILDATRNIVKQSLKSKDGTSQKDGMDISFAALHHTQDAENRIQRIELQWSGANNPIWILRKSDSDQAAYDFIEIKGDKQPIGYFSKETEFTTHSMELIAGDTIYLFSDGFQDQFGGEKGKKFKVSQLKEKILEIQHHSMAEQQEILASTFNAWKGNLEQTDDVCFIGVRV